MKKKLAHILLVENNPEEVRFILEVFRAQGIENPVLQVPDGKAALDLLHGVGRASLSPVPQIILLSLPFPDKEGLAFLRELRENPETRSCSVFILAAQAWEQEILEAYELNVAGYILKPLQEHSFYQVVETLHSYWTLIELPH